MRNIILCLAFLFSSVVRSAETTVQPVKILRPGVVKPAAVKQIAEDPGLTFSLSLNLRYSVLAEEPPAGTVRSEYATYEFVPTIKTQNYKLFAVADFYHQMKGANTSEWDNTLFDGTINDPWLIGDYVKLSPDILLAVPLFQRGSDFQSFIGARLTAALNSANTALPDLILKYGIQFGKLSYKSEMTNGAYNIDTRLRQRVHLGYKITEALTAMLYFQFDSNFLYDNTVKNTFAHETTLKYAFSESFSANIGIANGGGLYKGANQEEDNLKFYDKNTTEVFAGVGFGF